MEERELYFTDEYLPKIIERGSVILANIRNHAEIPDADWSVIEELHRIWFEDRLGWKKPKEDKSAQSVTQVGLFEQKEVVLSEQKKNISDKSATTEKSTVIDNKKTVTKKRKRK